MNFPLRVFGRSAGKTECHRASRARRFFLETCLLQLFAPSIGALTSLFERDERGERLAFQVRGARPRRPPGDGRVVTSALSTSIVPMRCPATFSTSSTRPRNPEVTIVIALRAVAREVTCFFHLLQ